MYGDLISGYGLMPGYEWYRELADEDPGPPAGPALPAPPAGQHRPGEPAECTCTRMVVPAIGETLDCPLAWRYVPGTGWLHPLPARRS